MLSSVVGKVFVHPVTRKEYGIIRLAHGVTQFSLLDGTRFEALLDDGCGNCFTSLADGTILYWDHETDELTRLAGSIGEFIEHCEIPAPVEFDERNVESVWIDPAFAKSIGKKVPKDGWVKKPKK